MKKINKLFILFVFIGDIAFSQTINIKSENFNDCCILYNTYYNKISIDSEEMSCEDILLEGDNLEIQKGSGCNFYLKVLNPYKQVSLSVYNKKRVLLKEQTVVITNKIPMPKIDIGCGFQMEYGPILCNKIDSIYCLPTMNDTLNRDIQFSVVSFLLVMLRKEDEFVYTEYINGNKISHNAKDFLSTLKFSDRMILKKILIKDSNFNYYTIDEKEFTVFSKNMN